MAWTEGGNAKLAGKGPGKKTTPPGISMPGWYGWLLSSFAKRELARSRSLTAIPAEGAGLGSG